MKTEILLMTIITNIKKDLLTILKLFGYCTNGTETLFNTDSTDRV